MPSTYRITNLLPTAPVGPRTMPAVAILPNDNNTTGAILNHIEDGLAPEPKPLHNARPIPVNNNISLPDQRSELLLTHLIFQVQEAVPLAPVEILVQDRHIRDVRRRDAHHASAHLRKRARDRGSGNDAGQVDDFEAGERPRRRGRVARVVGPPCRWLRGIGVLGRFVEPDFPGRLAVLACEVLVGRPCDCARLAVLLVHELI